MSFWDRVTSGVAEVVKKTADGTASEAKRAADAAANQLPSKKTEAEPEVKRTEMVRPKSVTKNRLERTDQKRDKGTIKVTQDKKKRANEIADDVIAKAEERNQEERERAQSGEDLIPDVKTDEEYIDDVYDWQKRMSRSAGRSLGDTESTNLSPQREAEIERGREAVKREAYEKEQERIKSSVVVKDDDEPDYSWDDDAKVFVDNRNKKTLPDPITYEQDLQRRSLDGENMYVPKKGQWIDAGDGRVFDGQSRNEYGDNVLMSHFITGDWSKGHAAAGYDEDEMAPVLADIVNGIGDSATMLDSAIRNARVKAAERDADWRFRVSTGDLYDFEDTRDSFETDEFRDYYDKYLKSERVVTRERPEDIRTTDKMYSGGSFYAQMRDESGNPLFDGDQPKMVKVGTFDAASNFDDAGNPAPSGSFDEETGMWVMPNGIYVDAAVDEDGNIFPAVTYEWDAETDDESKAIAWNEPYESFTSNGKREIPIADVVELIGGEAERENLNDNFRLFGQKTPIPDFLGLNKTPEEMSIEGEDGGLDPIKFLQNFAPMAVDGGLSSIPFMLGPKVGGLMTVNNIAQAMRGLDPYTYDAETGTYEAPQTMSKDQHKGHVGAVASETLFDSLFGLGKFGAGKAVRSGIGRAIRDVFPETEKSVARAARKEAAKMARPMPARIARTAGEEAWAEAVPEFFSPLDRGDYVGTYFADQKKDEAGNLVWDPAGNPVWDTETPIEGRVSNALTSIIPSAVLGGALGVAMGGPAEYGQYRSDKRVLRGTDGYVPVDRSKAQSVIVPSVMTEEEKAAAEDWYKRQQEAANG